MESPTIMNNSPFWKKLKLLCIWWYKEGMIFLSLYNNSKIWFSLRHTVLLWQKSPKSLAPFLTFSHLTTNNRWKNVVDLKTFTLHVVFFLCPLKKTILLSERRKGGDLFKLLLCPSSAISDYQSFYLSYLSACPLPDPSLASSHCSLNLYVTQLHYHPILCYMKVSSFTMGLIQGKQTQ